MLERSAGKLARCVLRGLGGSDSTRLPGGLISNWPQKTSDDFFLGHAQMASTIFYSWQSDLSNATNHGFIQTALERAARSIRDDTSIHVEPVVDRDTAGVPGSPDIATTILQKIDDCDVFVCDVSIINSGQDQRPTPNPNVLF